MTIASDGKVGIGTTAPNRQFTVEGDGGEPDISLVNLDNTNNNSNNIRFLSVGSDDSTRRVGAEIKGIYTLHNATNPTTDLSFTTRNAGGTLAERLHIDSEGAATFSSTVTTSTGLTKTVGKETIWVPAQAMTPTASNGCAALATVETTSGRPDMNVLDFDKDSDEFAQFAVAFPKSWDAGTVTFQFFWSGIAATTQVTMLLKGVAFADNDSIDTAYGLSLIHI